MLSRRSGCGQSAFTFSRASSHQRLLARASPNGSDGSLSTAKSRDREAYRDERNQYQDADDGPSTSSDAWSEREVRPKSKPRSRRAPAVSSPDIIYSESQPQINRRAPSTSNSDPFAAFRSYQESAMLKAVGIGRGGLAYNGFKDTEEERDEDSVVRLTPLFSRGWSARPEFTVKTLYAAIVRRCESGNITEAPVYMIMKLAQNTEDARTVVDAIAAVRGAFIRKGRYGAFHPKLCANFTQMCYTCDAPEVLAEALSRANELGLLLSLNRVHDLLRAWGASLDLHKMETVVKAMDAGGIPPNSKTAYILIRAAVNSGRQDVVERFASDFTLANLRLTPTTIRLVELGRARAFGQDATLNRRKEG